MYAIYGNMDPINIPQMLAYIPYMDPIVIVDHSQNSLRLAPVSSLWWFWMLFQQNAQNMRNAQKSFHGNLGLITCPPCGAWKRGAQQTSIALW